MQTQNGTKEITECLTKYEELLSKEYEKLSEEEKSVDLLTSEVLMNDKQLNNNFPGHIKAKYSDILKKSSKEHHYLQSILLNMSKTQVKSK